MNGLAQKAFELAFIGVKPSQVEASAVVPITEYYTYSYSLGNYCE